MIDGITALQKLTKKDKFVITVTVWKDHKVNTECHVHDFPTRDLPIARNDIGVLLHNMYLKDTQTVNDNQAEKQMNEEVKDLLGGT